MMAMWWLGAGGSGRSFEPRVTSGCFGEGTRLAAVFQSSFRSPCVALLSAIRGY